MKGRTRNSRSGSKSWEGGRDFQCVVQYPEGFSLPPFLSTSRGSVQRDETFPDRVPGVVQSVSLRDGTRQVPGRQGVSE